jgi:hypothetical protein
MLTYLPLLALASILALAPAANAAETSSIGYASVAEAMSSLRARPDVTIHIKAGWTIVDDRAHGILWSFTPPGHPAYPAAVKRVLTNRDGGWYVDTLMLCEAEKAACDKLAQDFYDLNDKMRRSIPHRHPPGRQSPNQ